MSNTVKPEDIAKKNQEWREYYLALGRGELKPSVDAQPQPLGRLKEELAAIKSHTPSAQLFTYDINDDDCQRETYIGPGSGHITAIHVPAECESAHEWLAYANREV